MPPSRRMGATPEMLYEALQQPVSSPTMLSDSGVATTALQSEIRPTSRVCEKHSWIDEKLQALLDRLDDEEARLLKAVTDGEIWARRSRDEYQDAETAYTTAKEMKKAADDAVKQAVIKVTETESALKTARALYNKMVKELSLELENLNADVELIKELIALIEELHAVTKGKPAVLQQEFMDKARRLASKMSTPKLRQQTMAAVSSLAEYEESNEVKAVLEELLSDANNRIGEINKQLAQLREDVRNAEDAHNKAKDDLQDALEKQTDAAQELAKHDPLEIARLKGVWEQAELSLKQARIRYDTDRKRFDREREIIGKIMAKIDANCAGAATPKELTPAQEWEGRTLIGKRDTTIAAGSAEHTIIMALEWTAQKTNDWDFLMVYGQEMGNSDHWVVRPDSLTTNFGAFSHDANNQVVLGMPDKASFMVIASKFSHVVDGVGFYHVYVKTPEDGTVWQVKHNVPINIAEKKIKIGKGYNGKIYKTQLFEGALDSGKIAFQMAALEKKYSTLGARVRTGIDGFTDGLKNARDTVKEHIGNVVVHVHQHATNVANAFKNVANKLKFW
jgi:hypothetical protein